MAASHSQRLRTVLFAVGVAAVVLFGISRISFKVDILKSLPRDLDEVLGLELYLEHFSRPDELIVVLSGENPDTVEEAAATLAEFLRARSDLVDEVIDHAPWEDDPAGLAEIVAYALLNRSPGEIASLERRLAPGASVLRLEEAIDEMTFAVSPEAAIFRAYDPFALVAAAVGENGVSDLVSSGASEFVSADGTLRVLYVRAAGTKDRSQYRDLIDWIGGMRFAVASWSDAHPEAGDVAVRFTGEPAFVAEISGGMERDMKTSGLATLLMVAAVFWLWYRRLRPLATLVALLLLVFLITLGIAGLAIRDITVMNVGFASILIGLTVDYGVLIYQSTLRNPGDPTAVRRACRRGILCAGATTALAFGSLATSSLPGLSELGILVAIGIAVGAATMLGLFAARMGSLSRSWKIAGPDEPISIPESFIFRKSVTGPLAWGVLALVAVSVVTLLVRGMPPLDTTSQSLRPRNSEAYEAIDDITARLLNEEAVGSILVRGKDAPTLRRRLEELEVLLTEAKGRGEVRRFMLPTAFVPDPSHQKENLAGGAGRLASQAARLSSELDEAGFAQEAALLLNGVLENWTRWGDVDGTVFPENRSARWMLRRMLRVPEENRDMLGAGHFVAAPGTDLRHLAAGEGVMLADWNQTMLAVLDRVPSEIFKILASLVVIVLAMLAFTFRGVREIAWVALSIALSLTMLLGLMRLLGWSWNFLNLATLLLTFGAGLDYSIHMLLGFQRSGNDVAGVQRDTGQALLVCALSTVAGFGSLGWASNIGLASLGKMCALGLFLNALAAVFLLPRLWLWFGPKR